jgi:FkbH-like protein
MSVTENSPPNPKKVWSNFQQALQQQPPTTAELFSIGLAGSFTVDPVIPYLGADLLESGFKPAFEIAPYNQIYQLCTAPDSFFGAEFPNAIVILWRLEDLLGSALSRARGGDREARERINAELQQFIGAVHTLRQSYSGVLIVSTPPYPCLPDFDITAVGQAASGVLLHAELLAEAVRGLGAIEGICLFDLNSLVNQIGVDPGHDIRKWYLYKQPYSEALWQKIGTQLGRVIKSRIISPKKVIVLDCDNTLWGGIVGEDGLAGIDLGYDFPGNAFVDFQTQLLQLERQGVLLAVASKNNPEDVYQVFDHHDAMVLKREHICVFEVHWRSKAESIASIAEALNLGIDSFVFIDDNPKELAEVASVHPQVICLQAPEDPAYLTAVLTNNALFDTAEITDEDLARSKMIRAELNRKEHNAGICREDFLNSLELQVKAFRAQPQHYARVVQLINKTNQFNLTTVRRNRDEFDALVENPSWQVHCIEVQDRFGSYGLVGVAILQRLDEQRFFLDTFLMSCRVLGREVETAFLNVLVDRSIAEGASVLVGEFRPSSKNALVKDLLRDHGFEASDEQWQAGAAEIKKPSSFITIVMD